MCHPRFKATKYDEKGTTAIIEAIVVLERTIVALASAVNTIISRLGTAVASLIAAAATYYTQPQLQGSHPDFPATPTEVPIPTVPISHGSSEGFVTPMRSINDVLCRKQKGSEEEKQVTRHAGREYCQTVYLEYHATKGDSLKEYSKQDRSRIRLTVTWFDSISTAQEKETLKDTSIELGERKGLTARLSGLLQLRLADLWRDISLPGKIHKALDQGTQGARLEVNALDSIINVKFKSVEMTKILGSLSSWRSKHEAEASSYKKKATQCH